MQSLQKPCSSETETNQITEKKITKVIFNTSSTAQGGGGSCKNKKPIGQVDCCDAWVAGQVDCCDAWVAERTR